MNYLIKLQETDPCRERFGITVALLRGTDVQVAVTINKTLELTCTYLTVVPFEWDGGRYDLNYINTFTEHWGKKVTCYVFQIRKLSE